ncbi:PKD domain-containing protein [Methanoculleus frigidifontis]|nr:PKD domain-containing protein [Methanoculleus sp. FWC-SCC1]
MSGKPVAISHLSPPATQPHAGDAGIRLTARVLIAVLTFSLLLTAASAQPTVTAGNLTLQQNASGTTTITVADVTNLGSVWLVLRYDPAVVLATSVDGGDFESGPIANINTSGGFVAIGAYQLGEPGLDGTVAVCSVAFSGAGSAGDISPLTVEVLEMMEATAAGTEIPAETVSGNVRILSPGDTPPVPSFTANETAGLVPLAVRFSDTSAGTPTGWLWNFGDGATSAVRNPEHTYTREGNFTVTLTASNEFGQATHTEERFISVLSVLYGDANGDGDVNQLDTLHVLREVVDLTAKPTAGTVSFLRSDVTFNGAIDIGDAMYIAQRNVGLRNPWFGLAGT